MLLENLHSTNFIHRDIKPNNFLIGRENNENHIYITDFGLSKRFMINNKHIPFRDKRSLIGTTRYASINMHIGIEPSRRDDLESLGYVLVYFIKGILPWQGLPKKKGISNIEQIGEVKMCTNLDTLCKGIPNCFKEHIKYCRNLKFDEEPDYKYLQSLYKNTCTELNITPSFEWIK
jgi:casein kinase I family protein HRR25